MPPLQSALISGVMDDSLDYSEVRYKSILTGINKRIIFCSCSGRSTNSCGTGYIRNPILNVKHHSIDDMAYSFSLMYWCKLDVTNIILCFFLYVATYLYSLAFLSWSCQKFQPGEFGLYIIPDCRGDSCGSSWCISELCRSVRGNPEDDFTKSSVNSSKPWLLKNWRMLPSELAWSDLNAVQLYAVDFGVYNQWSFSKIGQKAICLFRVSALSNELQSDMWVCSKINPANSQNDGQLFLLFNMYHYVYMWVTLQILIWLCILNA